MKKLLACTVLIGAMAAPSLMAIPDSGSVVVTRQVGYFTGSGGEFTVTGVNPTAFGSFQTFCIEFGTPIDSSGATVYQYQLNDSAVLGGSGGPSPDPVSIGTAFLFKEFAAGTLANYNYTAGAGRAASAGELQNVIWWLEDELWNGGANTKPVSSFVTLVEGLFANPKADANGAYGVRAMNLTLNGVDRQDMLTVPDGGLTVALLGMGLAGLGWVNRRIRR